MKITSVYFSPGGTTKIIANTLASAFDDYDEVDLLLNKKIREQQIQSDDVYIVAMPCFAGRIPEICTTQLKQFKGNGASVITAIAYGNRDIDDALLELNTILRDQGFEIIGSCAIVARHSIFPKIAEGSPTIKSLNKLKQFAEDCKVNIGMNKEIQVPGSKTYRPYSSLPLFPVGNRKCIKCGICSNVCPVNAIQQTTPRKTDTNKCIHCTACIYHCPQNARGFHGIKYQIGRYKFEKANNVLKNNMFFK